ncbi:amidohydrolase [Stenotrophomonas pictorum JCM 9942]|uniref:Amidohydrolase n=1 Tax=Stenotrophomonas pictorum JCM 9942 TaxID=1236960 RepID=A0A0R0AM99_9GAMM|nr:amidohydrolase [Stenotrophomonas pictorum]KRG42670.1 amidohydrolase [Stenotrophomonas pictorum JCM 9942]
MKPTRLRAALLGCLLSIPASVGAQDADVVAALDRYAARQAEVGLALWQRPELGYLETQSSALLQQELREAGFRIQAGVAGMPTAFVASYGRRGKGPVIGLLAEMDGLPAMAHAAEPVRVPLPGQLAGHACGHNLFGAASVGAARAIAQWLKDTGNDGEVRLYGTPAEEGGSGKVYMTKAGLFDGVDVVLHWHPAADNSAAQGTTLANISGKFRFQGRAAHAAIAPERGRSALDGVEAFNHMANLMREHVPDGTRIHYVISNGGAAPNVVPDDAEAYYYVRHTDPVVVREVFERLHQAAQGAAMGTGTTVAFEQTGGVFSLLPNDTLGQVMQAALQRVGGVRYDVAERAFAERMQQTLERRPALDEAAALQPYRADNAGSASTDVGDVSWIVPTAGVSTATWVPGTPAHSWQAVAASGSTIGAKGALNAAKTLALAAVALYQSPQTVAAAKTEFAQRRGADFTYQPLLQRTAPPLDYRRKAAD